MAILPDMPTENGSRGEFEDLVKLSFFSEIGIAIASARTLEETLQAVMDHIGRVFAPEHWSLLLRNRKTGELTFSLVTGSAADTLKKRVLPRGHGIAGWIAENAQPAIISDVGADSRFDPAMDKLADFETRSIIGVPLVAKNEVFGVIELINKLDGARFTALDLKVLGTIADFAAIAIERAYYVRVLKRVAMLDPLTNVYNRRVFSRYLERETARVQRHGTTFAMLMIDIDEFKLINDRHGHTVGDDVLKTVAQVTQQVVRKVDIVARYGGDEFVVLMPDSDQQAADHVCERIRQSIESELRAWAVKPTVSIGVHIATKETVDDIIAHVDAAMYREKSDRSYGDMPSHLQDVISFD